MKLKTLLSLPDNRLFQRTIIGVILFNAVILGLQTVEGLSPNLELILDILDNLCLAIFCVELTLKLAAQRLGFFRDSWNIFDFTVVAVALVSTTGPLSVLRALRVFPLDAPGGEWHVCRYPRCGIGGRSPVGDVLRGGHHCDQPFR